MNERLCRSVVNTASSSIFALVRVTFLYKVLCAVVIFSLSLSLFSQIQLRRYWCEVCSRFISWTKCTESSRLRLQSSACGENSTFFSSKSFKYSFVAVTACFVFHWFYMKKKQKKYCVGIELRIFRAVPIWFNHASFCLRCSGHSVWVFENKFVT